MRTAIILAGGKSTRMNGDKGLRPLGGEPLINHVIRRVSGLVDEVFLVLSSDEQRGSYAELVDEDVELLVDLYGEGTPLVGAMTGLRQSKGEYALVVACDMPFVSEEAVELLFREVEGSNGAVFRWPNGWIEPFVAVYRVEPTLEKALKLYEAGDLRIRMILLELPDVRMIPIGTLKKFDPELLTLYDADTEKSLRKAEELLKKQKN